MGAVFLVGLWAGYILAWEVVHLAAAFSPSALSKRLSRTSIRVGPPLAKCWVLRFLPAHAGPGPGGWVVGGIKIFKSNTLPS